MPDLMIPKRLRILRALTAKLEEIHPGNGYESDLRGKVFRGRAQFGRNDPIPMVAILQSPKTAESLPPPGNGVVYNGPLELLVQGFCVDDPNHPTDPAEMLLAEVKQCLAEVAFATSKAPYVWNEITKMRLGPSVCRPPDEEISSVAYFWLSLTVEFTENIGDPYAVSAAR